MLKLRLQYFGHLMWRTDSLEKTLMLGRLKAGGKGEDRGWDGRMASLTRWTCVWASSRGWWWTGKPGLLQSTGLQRVGHDWEIELNWSSGNSFYHMQIGLFGRKNGSCFCQLTVGWALEEQPHGVLVSLLRTIYMFAKGWWHDRLDVHEFEQAPEIGKGQGSLACCSPWGCKESNTTERLNWESGGSHRHKPLWLLVLGVWGASPSSESLKSWGATYWIQILCSSQSTGVTSSPPIACCWARVGSMVRLSYIH